MKYLVIANWKCNPTTLKGAKLLFRAIKKGIKKVRNTEVVICPPFIYLPILKSEAKGPSFAVSFGGQSCFYEEKGAFTGEISPKMLKDLGCQYVILGHSERRNFLKETDEMINKKIKAAMEAKLKPILCIGEKKVRNAKGAITNQLKKDLKGISKKDFNKIIIAYEPVWAIGTGKSCKPERAKETKDFIKKKINTKILYGGSVNSKNARDYIKVAFDGLLVGGASLNAKEFVKIAKSVSRP